MAAPISWREFFADIPQKYFDSFKSARKDGILPEDASTLGNYLSVQFQAKSNRKARHDYPAILLSFFFLLTRLKSAVFSALYVSFIVVNAIAVSIIDFTADAVYTYCFNVIFSPMRRGRNSKSIGFNHFIHLRKNIFDSIIKPLPEGVFAVSFSLVARVVRSLLAIPFFIIGVVIESLCCLRAFLLTSLLTLTALLDNLATALLLSPLYVKDAVGSLISCCFQARDASESKQAEPDMCEHQVSEESAEDIRYSTKDSLNFGQLKMKRNQAESDSGSLDKRSASRFTSCGGSF